MGRRARTVRTVVIERDEDEASTSEEEMDEEEEVEEEEQVNGDESEEEEEEVEEEEDERKSAKKRGSRPKSAGSREAANENGKQGRIKLSLKKKADCKVGGLLLAGAADSHCEG